MLGGGSVAILWVICVRLTSPYRVVTHLCCSNVGHGVSPFVCVGMRNKHWCYVCCCNVLYFISLGVIKEVSVARGGDGEECGHSSRQGRTADKPGRAAVGGTCIYSGDCTTLSPFSLLSPLPGRLRMVSTSMTPSTRPLSHHAMHMPR